MPRGPGAISFTLLSISRLIIFQRPPLRLGPYKSSCLNILCHNSIGWKISCVLLVNKKVNKFSIILLMIMVPKGVEKEKAKAKAKGRETSS